MGKRPRARASAKGDANGTNSQPLSLLSLPLEIRCMIWKDVVTTSGPIDLNASSLTMGAPAEVAKFRFTFLPLLKNGKKRKHIPYRPKPAADSLNWLRTNRQVYAEARPIVYSNLSLCISDALCMSAFLSQTPQTRIKPEMVQSLAFNLTLGVTADIHNRTSFPRYLNYCDGFLFATYSNHHGWERRPACTCPYCFAASNSILANAAEHLTALRELRLRITIRCTDGPANRRPRMSSIMSHGSQREGKLYRPSDPLPLVCKDNSEHIAEYAKWVCTQAPLRLVSNVKLEAVDVQFSLERIEHDPSVMLPRGGRCWCKTWKVDKESIENCGIAEEIRKHLMSEDPKEES